MLTAERTRKNHPQEFLGSVFVGGELHAQYPSARRTLCLREFAPVGELMLLRPTCVECLRRARHPAFVFSAPAPWRLRAR